MRDSASVSSGSPRDALAGVWRYIRFTLRLNRVRYLVWIAVLLFLLAYVGVFYHAEFDTQAKLDEFAAIGSTPGMVAMVGQSNAMNTLGGAVWTKIWMTLAMTLAIGMVFQVTHGARADEENGRTELFRSRPLGIHSTLTSVVGVSLFLCFLTGIGSAIVCAALGLDPEGAGITGSIVFGLSVMGCGWLGVGVGALTNQLSSSGTVANSAGSVIIMACYTLRLIGDIGNNALTWISPVGWAEKMAPWDENRGWLIIPLLALTAALLVIAFLIEAHRDYGSGVLKEKKGKSAATPLMRHPWGLTLRLYRGSIIGWMIGMVLAGLMFGSVVKAMVDLFSGVKLFSGVGNGIDALVGLLLSFIGLICLALPMQIFTGLRSDEAKGLTEAQLAGGVSRVGLVLERIAVAFCSAAVLLLLGGASFGASFGASVNDMSQFWRISLDALVYLPGIMMIIGIGALFFGFAPRATIPVLWALYAAMYFHVIISDALNLPDWVNNMLPFTGTPMLPYEKFSASVFWFAAAAVVFILLGIIGLRKRDVPQ
jgi:ABC-2 type transport system permease protein